MHVLGHVFIWLIALGAVAASVLTAKTYDVRNSWIKKIDQLNKDIDANEPIIAEKEAKLEALHAEKNNINLGWGEPFLNVPGSLRDQPTLQFVTKDAGIMSWLGALDQATQAAQVVYVFQPQPDGSSLFIGSFQFAGQDPQGGGLLFNATWTPRDKDFSRINNTNGPFRVRPLVPSHFPTQYVDMRSQMTITERLLKDKQDDLVEQKYYRFLLKTGTTVAGSIENETADAYSIIEFPPPPPPEPPQVIQIRKADIASITKPRIADAQTILDRRNAQLEGPEGLVPQLQSSEDTRDKELEELDFWRRQVDDARQKIEELIKENRSLEQQIDSPADEGQPAVTAQVTRK